MAATFIQMRDVYRSSLFDSVKNDCALKSSLWNVQVDHQNPVCYLCWSEVTMPPKTRAIWLRHQQRVQPRTTDTVRVRGWDLKTRPQRTRWLNVYKAADAAHQAAIDALGNVTPLYPAIERRINNPARPRRWTQLSKLLEDLTEVDDLLEIAQTAAADSDKAWRDLVDTEDDQPPVPASTHYAHVRSIQAKGRVRVLGIRKARYEGVRMHPPVDPNTAGIRQVRETDLREKDIRQARRTAWRASRAINHERLELYGNGTEATEWRPWVSISGGMGKGCLWLHFDDNDEVDDRVFRKDTWLKSELRWRDPAAFHGDVSDETRRLPNELECHGRLSSAPGIALVRSPTGPAPTYPELLAWVDNTSMSYRMYTEWCGLGSLEGIIDHYHGNGTDVPEPFIWCVAEALASAGTSMLGGTQLSFGPPGYVPAEANIVHRDIKPGNVFLAEPVDGDDYPHYPNPLLADFGLAFIANNNPHNPRWYLEAGTPSYKAPEQIRWRDADTHQTIDPVAMGEETNVYGYGLVLYSLLTRKRKPAVPLWEGDPALDSTLAIPVAIAQRYSNQLTGLVNDCLQYDPTRRPTFQEIRHNMQNDWLAEGVGGHNVTQNMRSGIYGYGVHIYQPNDLYKIGTAGYTVPSPSLDNVNGI